MTRAAIVLIISLTACRGGYSQPAAAGSGFKVIEVARGLTVPWSFAFAPDGRILFTERPGRVRVIERGALRRQPLHVFRDVASSAEEGLMGIALHPRFASNHFLYLSYAYADGRELFVRVVRFREDGTSLSDAKVILDRVPAARFHAGSELAFGPDGKLYVTTGDATERTLAQKMDSLAGKILRLNDDGSVPADNPFKGSPIFTLGHRNPQGMAWHPDSRLMYSAEHGPSGFDGPGGGDEVNVIRKGANYGWPIIHHNQKREGLMSPVAEYTPAVAPGGVAFYTGKIARFRNNLFMACLRGEKLQRVELDPKNPERVIKQEAIVTGLGRIREVAMGLDGALYFSTSNRDGRGSPDDADDRIFKIVPR